MKTFKLTCPADGYSTTVMADTKEEAVAKLLADEGLKAHTQEKHPDMMSKTPEEMSAMTASMAEEVMPEAPVA